MLAHGSALFLDELAEFSPSVLDTLREPLEEGAMTMSRAGTTATYPARFTLVAAMNPCPREPIDARDGLLSIGREARRGGENVFFRLFSLPITAFLRSRLGVIIALVAAIVGAGTVGLAGAITTGLIYACVNNSSGTIKIVSATT